PDSQRALTEAYVAIGAELGARVVPVGVAWEQFRSVYVDPDLYDADGSHPSPAGSYLAACTFLGALFGKSPVGASVLTEGMSVDVCAPRRVGEGGVVARLARLAHGMGRLPVDEPREVAGRRRRARNLRALDVGARRRRPGGRGRVHRSRARPRLARPWRPE